MIICSVYFCGGPQILNAVFIFVVGHRFELSLHMIISKLWTTKVTWEFPPASDFMASLESQLPAEMHPEDQGNSISVTWDGGEYRTGKGFSKNEYETSRAPEVNLAVVGHNQMMSEYCLAPEYPPPKKQTNKYI